MNVPKFVIGAVAVFVVFAIVYFGAEALFADQFMAMGAAMNLRATPAMPTWIGHVLYTVMFCYIFLQGYENKGIGEGVRYGILIGLFLTGINLSWYGMTDIVLSDAIIWWAVDIISSIAGGATFAALYKPAGATPAS